MSKPAAVSRGTGDNRLADVTVSETELAAFPISPVQSTTQVNVDPGDKVGDKGSIPDTRKAVPVRRVLSMSDMSQTSEQEREAEKAEADRLALERRELLYGSRSLFFLNYNNRLRQILIDVTEHRAFAAVSLLVIIVNSAFIAAEDPLQSRQSARNKFINDSEIVFTSLFTVELLLLVAARGFCLHKFSYLRDPWNWLDFIIVIAGWLTLIPSLESFNVSSLRTLRVLRPLKTIKTVQGMRIVVSALLAAIPMFLNVSILWLFAVMIFGIVGIQLFAGLFRQQCLDPVTQTFPDQYNITSGNPPLCSLVTGAGRSCASGQLCVDSGVNPNFGITHFDHIAAAFLTLFQCITLEGWVDVMYDTQDASSDWAVLYFLILILFCSFFIVNLALAVIYAKFAKISENEDIQAAEDARVLKAKEDKSEQRKRKKAEKIARDRQAANAKDKRSAQLARLNSKPQLPTRGQGKGKGTGNGTAGPPRETRSTAAIPVRSTSTPEDKGGQSLHASSEPVLPHQGRDSSGPRPGTRSTRAASSSGAAGDKIQVVPGTTTSPQPVAGRGRTGSAASVASSTGSTHPPAAPPMIRRTSTTQRAIRSTSDNAPPHMSPRRPSRGSSLGLSDSSYDPNGTQPAPAQRRASADVQRMLDNDCDPVKVQRQDPSTPSSTTTSAVHSGAPVHPVPPLLSAGATTTASTNTAATTNNNNNDNNNNPTTTTNTSSISSVAMAPRALRGPGSNDTDNLASGRGRVASDSSDDVDIEDEGGSDISSAGATPATPAPVGKGGVRVGVRGGVTQYPYGADGTQEGEDLANLFFSEGGTTQIQPPANKFRALLWHTCTHKAFTYIIMGFIVINTLLLAMEHHQMPQGLADFLYIANIILTAIFILELLIKVVGLGPRGYVRDRFNIFDAIIVAISIVELILGSGGAVTVFRAFRLMRVFKLVRSWQSLRQLLEVIAGALAPIGNAAFVLLLFIFIFAVLGMQLFGGQIRFPGESPEVPRHNFDNFLWSIITVFQILTGENWNEVMYDVVRATHWTAAFYFVVVVVIGNYVLLNLFQAILLQNFAVSHPEDEEEEEDGDTVVQEINPTNPGAAPSILKPSASGTAAGGGEIEMTDMRQQSKGSSDDIHSVPKAEQQQKQQPSHSSHEDHVGPRGSNQSVVATPRAVEVTMDEQNRARGRPALSSTTAAPTTTTAVAVNRDDSPESAHDGGSGNVVDVKDSSDEPSADTTAAPTTINRPSVSFSETDKKQPRSSHGDLLSVASEQPSSPRPLKRQQSLLPGEEEEGEDGENGVPRLRSKSLFLWAPDNRMRVALARIVFHPVFEGVIIFLIVVSSVLLALENPSITKGSPMQRFLFISDIFFVSVFSAEMLMKIFALGFVLHEGAYLRSHWNQLDCFVVIVSILTLSLTSIDIQFLRALRALRPLRVVSRSEGMRVVVFSLVRAIPGVVNVGLVCLLFWLIFGILGVQLFAGKFYYCSDPTVETRMQCEMLDASTGLPRGEWKNTRSHFNNILAAMLSLFELSTLELWPQLMYQGVDAVGVDRQPSRDHNQFASLYYVSFLVVGAFFALGLLVGVVIDNFIEIQQQFNGAAFLTAKQAEWVEAQRTMMKFKPLFVPPMPRSRTRQPFFYLVMHPMFDIVIMSLILLNIAILAMEHYDQDSSISQLLYISNLVFTAIFFIEMVLKLIGIGPRAYVSSNWNLFDAFIVVLSIIGIWVRFGPGATLFRVFRVFRIFRVVKSAKGIRTLLQTLIYSIPTLWNVGSICILLFFIYAVAGVSVFGTVRYGQYLNEHANFSHFGLAMLTLFRMATGESWNGIMYDCMVQEPDCSVAAEDCGSRFAWIYFVSFMTLMFLVMVNLFIAVIIQNFSFLVEENTILSTDDYETFLRVWARHDPLATYYIPSAATLTLIRELPPPLGLGLKATEQQARRYLFRLEIPVYDGKIHFKDTMLALAQHRVGVTLPENNSLSEEISRKWQRGFKNSPVIEAGYTIDEMYSAQLMQQRWRAYVARKKAERAKQNARMAHKSVMQLQTATATAHDSGPAARVGGHGLKDILALGHRNDDHDDDDDDDVSEDQPRALVGRVSVHDDLDDDDVDVNDDDGINSTINSVPNSSSKGSPGGDGPLGKSVNMHGADPVDGWVGHVRNEELADGELVSRDSAFDSDVMSRPRPDSAVSSVGPVSHRRDPVTSQDGATITPVPPLTRKDSSLARAPGATAGASASTSPSQRASPARPPLPGKPGGKV